MVTYSIKQLQERWNVGEHTILKFIHSGELEAFSVGRNRVGEGRPKWRCTEEAVRKFESSRASTPATSQPVRRRRKPEGVIEFYK